MQCVALARHGNLVPLPFFVTIKGIIAFARTDSMDQTSYFSLVSVATDNCEFINNDLNRVIEIICQDGRLIKHGLLQ